MDRPCPFISCKYHNVWWFYAAYPKKFVDMNNERLAVLATQIPETCTLDCIERYGPEMQLEWIGKVFDVTRECIRQIEWMALRKLKIRRQLTKDHGSDRERSKEPYLLVI